MATASALEDLAPIQRRDSMAKKMTKMFKTPETHTAFLTSSRFALDLIKVCDALERQIFHGDLPECFLRLLSSRWWSSLP